MKNRCRHGAGERWVLCEHVDRIETARLVPEGSRASSLLGGARVTLSVQGEAFCPRCTALVDADRAGEVNVAFACGACVRERWKLENAS